VAAAGGRVGWLAQSEIDRFQHPYEIAIDLAIPESKNAKAGVGQCAVTIIIARLMVVEIVLAAVDLDNEAMCETDKIHDETLARRLSAEVIAARPP
jgi:hypothetical protein